MTETDPIAVRAERFKVLLSDYELARQDERTLVGTQATFFSVTVATFGFILAGLSTTAMSGGLPDAVLAAVPMLPLALLAFLQLLGTEATIRSYYLRGLEQELSVYAGAPMDALSGLRPASMVDLLITVKSMRRGRPGLRVLTNIILLAIIISFPGLMLYIALAFVKSVPVSVCMIVFYGTAAAFVLSETFASSIGGRRLFLSTLQRHLDTPERRMLPVLNSDVSQTLPDIVSHLSSRRLWSYLLYPRPEDWIKLTISPVVFLCTAWSTGSWNAWPRFLLLWALLEFLIYQARYQWNDVRGLEHDSQHPEARARARLPIGRTPTGTGRNIIVSLTVGVVRLVAALIIGIQTGEILATVALLAAVLLVALVYELLRDRTTELTDPLRTTPSIVGVWIVVSLGYATRSALGLSVGGISLTEWAGSIGVLCIAAFGSMFVLIAWVLEASSLCARPGDSLPQADPWYSTAALDRKPHVGALLRYAGINPVPASTRADLPQERISREHSAYGGRLKILSTSGYLHAPWNLAFLAAAALSAPLGLLLSHPGRSALPLYLLAAIGILIFATAIVRAASPFSQILFLLIGVLVQTTFSMLASADTLLLSAVPWFLISATYLGFRASSYRDTKRPAEKLAALPRKVLIFILGPRTARSMGVTGHVTPP